MNSFNDRYSNEQEKELDFTQFLSNTPSCTYKSVVKAVTVPHSTVFNKKPLPLSKSDHCLHLSSWLRILLKGLMPLGWPGGRAEACMCAFGLPDETRYELISTQMRKCKREWNGYILTYDFKLTTTICKWLQSPGHHLSNRLMKLCAKSLESGMPL